MLDDDNILRNGIKYKKDIADNVQLISIPTLFSKDMMISIIASPPKPEINTEFNITFLVNIPPKTIDGTSPANAFYIRIPDYIAINYHVNDILSCTMVEYENEYVQKCFLKYPNII